MRVKIKKPELDKIFEEIRNHKNCCLKEIAQKTKTNVRTLNGWKNGKTTMPLEIFEKLIKISGIKKENVENEILNDLWHIREAARKGGLQTVKLHGNFGTAEGRRKGGINSINFHKRKKSAFKTSKKIKRPRNSKNLAEFLGILVGDGHLGRYQASVTTNSQTDLKHALFVKQLAENLFGVSGKIKLKKDQDALDVVFSSIKLVHFLNKKGMPIGNKIKNDLCVPSWILKNINYQRSFMRGLFDTDGCIYIDTHKIGERIYKHFGWTITSYADKLLIDIINILKRFGFSPTHRETQKSVYLRRQNEISRYFEEIGTNNPKHHKRYFGEVPKWT